MKYKNLIFGLLISFLLTSCDCWVIIDGEIIDSRTKEPIEKVRLEFLNIESTEIINSTVASQEVNRIFSTDSIGIFFMRSNNYGFCPNIEPKIKIWKDGYKTKEFIVTEEISRNELVIELEKE
ncbi:hypothetical protein [Winogradskyella sp. PC D3.3]